MYSDDYLSREIRDILSRKPDATHKEVVQALVYRARLKWGRIPPIVQLWQQGLDSADDITRKYSPDQPRVPAGNSDGGQWTRDPNSSEGGREARQNATYDYLRDKKGNLMRNINGDVIPYPRAFPPEYFVKQGLAQSALPANNEIEVAQAASRLYFDLAKFNYGDWDMQRRFLEGSKKPTFNENLRDYSTVAIGLYSAAAHIPQSVSLAIQILFARIMSSFPDDEPKFILNYPQRNRFNTNLGYQLARQYMAQ